MASRSFLVFFYFFSTNFFLLFFEPFPYCHSYLKILLNLSKTGYWTQPQLQVWLCLHELIFLTMQPPASIRQQRSRNGWKCSLSGQQPQSATTHQLSRDKPAGLHHAAAGYNLDMLFCQAMEGGALLPSRSTVYNSIHHLTTNPLTTLSHMTCLWWRLITAETAKQARN